MVPLILGSLFYMFISIIVPSALPYIESFGNSINPMVFIHPVLINIGMVLLVVGVFRKKISKFVTFIPVCYIMFFIIFYGYSYKIFTIKHAEYLELLQDTHDTIPFNTQQDNIVFIKNANERAKINSYIELFSKELLLHSSLSRVYMHTPRQSEALQLQLVDSNDCSKDEGYYNRNENINSCIVITHSRLPDNQYSIDVSVRKEKTHTHFTTPEIYTFIIKSKNNTTISKVETKYLERIIPLPLPTFYCSWGKTQYSAEKMGLFDVCKPFFLSNYEKISPPEETLIRNIFGI